MTHDKPETTFQITQQSIDADNPELLPPHKQLYQDIFDWAADVKGLPLASDMDELISIVLKSRGDNSALEADIHTRNAKPDMPDAYMIKWEDGSESVTKHKPKDNPIIGDVKGVIVPLYIRTPAVTDDAPVQGGVDLRNAIFDALRAYNLQHTYADEDTHLALVDAVTPPCRTIDVGEDELFLLADHITVSIPAALTHPRPVDDAGALEDFKESFVGEFHGVYEYRLSRMTIDAIESALTSQQGKDAGYVHTVYVSGDESFHIFSTEKLAKRFADSQDSPCVISSYMIDNPDRYYEASQ